jgi:hypothetical protein
MDVIFQQSQMTSGWILTGNRQQTVLWMVSIFNSFLLLYFFFFTYLSGIDGGYNLIITLSLDGYDLPAVANDFWMDFDWKSTTNCALDGINLQFFTSSSLHTYLALMGGYNLIITLSLDGYDLPAVANDFLRNLNRNSMFYFYQDVCAFLHFLY